MIPEFSGGILTPDYKLFLASIYFAGVLTGGMIFSIVAAIKEKQEKERVKVYNNRRM